MGEVYRARDSGLNRDVAIKVLPALFALDPDRLTRFEREAQVLASLNHPNIAHIYGAERAAGTLALVMELVEGEDLAQRLARGPLPLDEALAIARQIADGLEAAHEQGIIHRDLKPANIKVREDGAVKLLDFGLAKALGAESASAAADRAHSPTFTSPAMTQMGMIIGTAAYMAPEQAKGKAVDKRADIWAFGVVLYEMLTGASAFRGESVTETLAAVIGGEPDMTALPANVPAGIRGLIARCLRKDPRVRLRDIGDARQALEDSSGADGAGAPARANASGLRLLVPWAIAAAAIFAAVAAWILPGRSPVAHQAIRRFTIDLPWHSVPNWNDFDVALSPRATHIAYYGRRANENDVSVYVRALDSLDAAPLADAREARAMAFSPDGEWIALVDPHGVRKVSIHGGRPQELARVKEAYTLSWGTDNSILVSEVSGLLRVPASGGPGQQLTRLNSSAGELAHLEPFHLPTGKHALMAILRDDGAELAVADLGDGTYRGLSLRGNQPAYLSSGHLVFRQGKSVMAAGFDLKALRVTSDPIPILDRVRLGPYVAADGTMAYVQERDESTARLAWVDRAGRSTPIPGERLDYSHLALGGEGHALLNFGDDVYVRDIEAGTRRLLAKSASFPISGPDARWATYTTFKEGTTSIVRQPIDGSAPPETLITSKDGPVPTSWNSLTGELAYFDEASDIWTLKPGGTPQRYLSSPSNERSGMFSPDGRWLAYVSDETGSYQVYVIPYPGPGPKVAVSVDGGMAPIWSPDGRQLFFRRGGRMLAAAMTYSPTVSAARPIELFQGAFTLDFMGHQRYAVAAEGRFLMVEDDGDFRSVVVQGWSEEVKRLVQRQSK